MWAAIAAIAMQVIGGLNENEGMKAQARLDEAQNMLNKTATESQNKVRRANNELAAASGSLNRFRQSLNNRQVQRQVGEETEAIQTNLFRAMDDLTDASLEDRLNSAFELGSLNAAASAAGVGGGSRDVLNSTLRLAAARRAQAIEEQGEVITYDSLKMLSNTHASVYTSMDSSLVLDQINRNREIFMPKFVQEAPSGWSAALGAAGQAVASNPQTFATAFDTSGGGGGSPQGGFMSQVNTSRSTNNRNFQGTSSGGWGSI